MQNKKGYVLTKEKFLPPMEKAFSQAIYIPYIEPQTVLSAGYPPRQMKNLLIIGKAQRKGIYTKILSKALFDITFKNKFSLLSKCLSWKLIFLLCIFYQFGLDCWGFHATVTPVTHLLFRQSTFLKLTLFLYRSSFITYLSFCFNCKCRSVNISTISFNSML